MQSSSLFFGFRKVLFLGSKLPVPQDVQLTYALFVRRDKVRKALQWLIANNHLYRRLHEAGDLVLSEENLSKYPENAVPDSIVRSAILRVATTAALAEDTSSYTRPDHCDAEVKDDFRQSDATGATWTHTGVVDANALGLEPEALDMFVDGREDALLPAELRNMPAPDDRVLLMPAGSRVFILDRARPNIDHLAFPILFPYGVAGPSFKRQRLIGNTKYIRHTMHLSDRRFATHPPFCFTMFNVLQRQRVCWGASRTLRAGYFMDFSKEISKLTPQAIADVIRELKQKQSAGKASSLRACSGPNKETGKALSSLFNQMCSLGGGNLPRTNGSRRTARKEICGMITKLGLPSFFITVNPEDKHSPLVCHFNGKTPLALSLDDPDSPDGVPSAIDRLHLIANDPLAAVQFSSHLMDAFIAALLGFAREETDKKLGVLGDVKAYHFNDEEQNRGSLHYHGFVWLKHQPDHHAFAELLRQENFQKRVLDYLSAVIRNEPAALWDPSELRAPLKLPGACE